MSEKKPRIKNNYVLHLLNAVAESSGHSFKLESYVDLKTITELSKAVEDLKKIGLIPDLKIGDIVTYNDQTPIEHINERSDDVFFKVVSLPWWGEDENCDLQWLVDCEAWGDDCWERAQVSCLRLATDEDFKLVFAHEFKYERDTRVTREDEAKVMFELYKTRTGSTLELEFREPINKEECSLARP